MAFALRGSSSLAAAAAIAIVFLAGVVVVDYKVWLNKINPPPHASLPSPFPPF
jgi:hypothetical protein